VKTYADKNQALSDHPEAVDLNNDGCLYIEVDASPPEGLKAWVRIYEPAANE